MPHIVESFLKIYYHNLYALSSSDGWTWTFYHILMAYILAQWLCKSKLLRTMFPILLKLIEIWPRFGRAVCKNYVTTRNSRITKFIWNTKSNWWIHKSVKRCIQDNELTYFQKFNCFIHLEEKKSIYQESCIEISQPIIISFIFIFIFISKCWIVII